MLEVALTGGIGMGKSTICAMFREFGVFIWSADDAVHELYKKGGAANLELAKKYADIFDNNGDIDRQKLSQKIMQDAKILNEIEAIVHPLVKKSRNKFILEGKKAHQDYVIIDIPLLFETKSEKEFDKIIVVDCDAETQKKRVLSRPNMTIEKFNVILNKQIPNNLKVSKSDFVIDTSTSIDESRIQVKKIDQDLREIAKNA